jgi:hypothetical protein
MRWKTAIFFLASLLFFQACEIINPAEELPAFVTIKAPKVVLDENTGFSTDAGIRNIWFYHANQLQGIYEFHPEVGTREKTFPVLGIDNFEYFMEGGIYETGQSAFQLYYPFWERITFNWQPGPKDTLVLQPEFHYVESSRYIVPMVEHFEGGAIDFQPFGTGITNTDTTFLRHRYDDVFRGTGCGYVSFDANHRFFEAINTTPFNSVKGSNIYTEITYKNTMPFSVGLIYQSATQVGSIPIVTVGASERWNTIYVHMTKEIRETLNAHGDNTLLYLWLKTDGEGKDGEIRLDDVRIIRES